MCYFLLHNSPHLPPLFLSLQSTSFLPLCMCYISIHVWLLVYIVLLVLVPSARWTRHAHQMCVKRGHVAQHHVRMVWKTAMNLVYTHIHWTDAARIISCALMADIPVWHDMMHMCLSLIIRYWLWWHGMHQIPQINHHHAINSWFIRMC